MTTIRYGGQAVIEGVMMSGPKGKAIAVRNEDGCLVYKIEDKKPLAEQHALFRLPVVRGVANFCASMVGGILSLRTRRAYACLTGMFVAVCGFLAVTRLDMF